MFGLRLPSLEADDQPDLFDGADRGDPEQRLDVDEPEAAYFHEEPGGRRSRAVDERFSAPAHVDDVVGDEPMTAADQLEPAFALPDPALAEYQHAETEQIDEHPVNRGALREVEFEPRRELGDGCARGRRRHQERDAAALTSLRELARRAETSRHQDAGDVVREDGGGDGATFVGIARLEKADLALAKYQHAAGADVFGKPCEREPGLLHVGAAHETRETLAPGHDFDHQIAGVDV